MNVLIVSENFLNGGLETQIATTVESLSDRINFFFAFGKYNKNWNFKNVYDGFNFSPSSTINQFCEDVNNLVKIIEENKIDIIQVHPFYSFFPAVFASRMCKIPIIYTYHGIGSYSFPFQLIDNILFNMLLDYETDKIFCVNTDGNEIFSNILFDTNKIIFIPNSIDINKFKVQPANNNKSWALISRLDIDKIKEIKKIVSLIDKIDIKELHIIGDGSEKQDLQSFINANGLSNKVFLDGYNNNIPKELSANKYNGIIGIGRVAMEGVSMHLPVLLVGYNKIAGLIDNDLYNKIESKNFINKDIPDIDLPTLKSQIQNVYNNSYDCNFYKSFENKFSSQAVASLYHEELSKTNYLSLIDISSMFDEFKAINLDESFYNNALIYNIIKKYCSLFVRMPHQKNLLIFSGNIFSQEKNINRINTINITQNDILSNYEKKLSNYEENLSKMENEVLEQKQLLLDQQKTILNQKLLLEKQEKLILTQNKILEEHEKNILQINQNTMTINNLKRKIKYKFKH